ncbi:UDP-2,3-diacylglucosamine hydrolase [Caulifigura coniformis]|uniref:UDP-2,3-diacylglucosamine hydrolase n=2 Tax=Caulifigura coniformis TaxID=2527983 RepID=A0A517SAA7_9PLAN|nr:UDP-2,3-diacylglucosamine hydrolase [Caulifigura coniformis]
MADGITGLSSAYWVEEARSESTDGRRVRSIFLSDLHLGCRHTKSAALLSFLKHQKPEFLYLVGDIIDGWKVKRGWYWNDEYSFLVRRLIGMMKHGTIVRYCPGNHDEFLRNFFDSFGSIEIADEFVHRLADGRMALVMHGDQFDTVVRHHRWLSMLGDFGYDALLALNRLFNWARQMLGMGYWSLSAYIKRQVKRATSFISNFEDVITRHAASHGCNAVICGHIHTPRMSERNGIDYWNTGDWVESCTALVEYTDGSVELIYHPWSIESPSEADNTPDSQSDPMELESLASMSGVN